MRLRPTAAAAALILPAFAVALTGCSGGSSNGSPTTVESVGDAPATGAADATGAGDATGTAESTGAADEGAETHASTGTDVVKVGGVDYSNLDWKITCAGSTALSGETTSDEGAINLAGTAENSEVNSFAFSLLDEGSAPTSGVVFLGSDGGGMGTMTESSFDGTSFVAVGEGTGLDGTQVPFEVRLTCP